MKNSFAIVGAGSTTISFLNAYLDAIEAGNALSNVVYVFEKRQNFGPGAAYEEDLASNLLNTKTGYITPFSNKPGAFKLWLDTYPEMWRSQFPDFDSHADGYAPRALFGLYLQYQMEELVKRAVALGVLIVKLQAEIIDVEHLQGDFLVVSRCGLRLRAAKVFLFCGTLQKKKTGHDEARILDTPYPVTKLKNKIEVEADVGIVGARLSAIDTIVALVENGHRGRIVMHSRSGYFPCVRGTQGRITPKHISAENIENLLQEKGRLQLSDIFQLIQCEIAEIDPNFQSNIAPLLTPPRDLAAFLAAEIEAARSPRPWQAVLYATNSVIELLWNALDEAARQKFMAEYFSIFMAYRVSIPVENAVKILSYLHNGQLEFVEGATSSPSVAGTKVHIEVDGEPAPRAYDHVIHAIGAPRRASELESDLVANLLRKGLISCHSHGGLAIDTDSYEAIGTGEASTKDLYVIGELTNGAFFFTSALEINARHVSRCLDNLCQSQEVNEVQRLQA